MHARISLVGICLALGLVVGCTGGPGNLPESVSGSGTGSTNPIRRTGGSTVEANGNGSSGRGVDGVDEDEDEATVGSGGGGSTGSDMSSSGSSGTATTTEENSGSGG